MIRKKREFNEDYRRPIKNGTILYMQISEYAVSPVFVKVRIDNVVENGRGSTCIVYDGTKLSDSGKELSKLIIKEFYPLLKGFETDIKRAEDGALNIPSYLNSIPEFKLRKKQFEKGYHMQQYMSNSDVMEIMVKPMGIASYGDSSYIISDKHMGSSLKTNENISIEAKLNNMILIAEMIDILHDKNFLFLDLCPENILYINRPKALKLFDADSIINLNNIDDITLEDIRYRSEFASPEIKTLSRCRTKIEFDIKKKNYISKSINIYSAGILFSYIMYNKSPDKICEDKKKTKEETEIYNIILKCIDEKRFRRYNNISDVLKELMSLQKRMYGKTYKLKKYISNANGRYVSYDMLEKNPVFKYCRYNSEQKIFDVVIAGKHIMRRNMLQVIISCAQMLNSRLNIRIVDEDSVSFWKDYTSENANPELANLIVLYIDNECKKADWNKDITDTPLAYIYLYTDDSFENIKNIRDEKSSYFIFLFEDLDKNIKYAEKLGKDNFNNSLFIGYMDGESKPSVISQNKNIVYYPLSKLTVSDIYNEKAFKSNIFKRGLIVHSYYYKFNKPYASNREIEEDFKKDEYSISSSERCALHMDYKLASAGIDHDSINAAEEYYNKVLCNTDEFDKQVALEHRSWTAFMVTNGAISVPDENTFKRYAYKNGNDWRNKTSPEHIMHPCIKTSFPGKKLPKTDWENLDKKFIENLDTLDRWSLIIDHNIRKIIIKNKKEIDRIIISMKESPNMFSTDCQEYINMLEDSVSKCINKNPMAHKIWDNALKDFKTFIDNKNLYKNDMEKYIDNINELMKPVLKFSNSKDFKCEDEEILKALPYLLKKSKNDKFNMTIVKEESHKIWENIMSSLYIEPKRVIIVTKKNADYKKDMQAFYENILRTRGIETEVRIYDIPELKKHRYVGDIWVDITGTSRDFALDLIENKNYKNLKIIEIKDKKLISEQQTSVAMFNKEFKFSVEEICMLNGIKIHNVLNIRKNKVLDLISISTIEKIYENFSRKEVDYLFEFFRKKKSDRKKRYYMDCEDEQIYITKPIEQILLKISGIERILKTLEEQEVISINSIPLYDEMDSVSYSSKYSGISSGIKKIIDRLYLDNIYQRYEIIINRDNLGDIKDFVLYNDNRYMFVDQKENLEFYSILEKLKDVLSEGEFKHIFSYIDSKNKKTVLRYASKNIQSILEDENIYLLKKYSEYDKLNNFNDIVCNLNISFEDDPCIYNIDIAGIKDNEFYAVFNNSSNKKIINEKVIYKLKNTFEKIKIEFL